jgi:TRAP-type C4-dicarboxylate transport system permease small subunit
MHFGVLRTLRLLERISVVTLFGVMLVLFFVNVAVRVVAPSLSSNIAWAEEAARLAMIWGIFLIAGITLERGRHIAMSSVLLIFPLKVRLMVRRVVGVVGAGFFAYFCYLATRMTIFVFGTGQIIPSLNLSSAYLYMGAAIGLGLLTIRYVLEVIQPRDPAILPGDG